MQTVPDADPDLRVLVLSPVSTRAELRRQLIPLGAKLTFAETIAELSQVTRDAAVYQVALIPASLPHSEWWELWGAISMLAVRLAIRVYAEFSSFELWAGGRARTLPNELLPAGNADTLQLSFGRAGVFADCDQAHLRGQ